MCIDRVTAGMLPICVKTPHGNNGFWRKGRNPAYMAQKRLEIVKKTFPKAFLADVEDVSVIYLLSEEKEHYYEHAAFM